MDEELEKLKKQLEQTDEPEQKIEILQNIAKIYKSKNNYQEALECELELYQIMNKILDDNDPNLLTLINNLSIDYSNLGDYENALMCGKKAYERNLKVFGLNDLNTLKALNNLANIYFNMGFYEEALKCFKEEYEIRLRIYGPDHPDTLSSLSNLANVFSVMGDYEDALMYCKEVYERKVRVLGPDHPDTLSSLNNLAISYSNIGDYDNALKHAKEAYDRYKEILGPDHPNTLMSLNNLANRYSETGDFKNTIKYGKEAYDRYKKLLGSDNPSTLYLSNNLANRYSETGDYKNALKYGKEAYDRYKEILGPDHPNTLMSLNNLANIYLNLRDYDNALKYGKEAYDRYKEMLGPIHPNTLMSLNNLANIYLNSGDYDNALKYSKVVYEKCLSIFGPDYSLTLNAKKILDKCDEYINPLLFIKEQIKNNNIQLVNNAVEQLDDYHFRLLRSYIEYNNYSRNNLSLFLQGAASRRVDETNDELSKFTNTYPSFCELFFNKDLDDILYKDYTLLLKDKNIFFDVKKDQNQFLKSPDIIALTNQIQQRKNEIEEINQKKELKEKDSEDIKSKNNEITQIEKRIADASTGTNLQKILNKIKISNIQDILNDSEIIMDIYKLANKDMFVIYSKYSDPIEFAIKDNFNELKDYLYQNQINKAYICADGNYYNENFEDILPFDTIYISSVRSLFDIDYCVAFADPDYGNKFHRVESLIGSAIEDKIFHSIFTDGTVYTKKEVSKEYITRIKSPIILHISTHGSFDESKEDSKKNSLIMCNYNNILDYKHNDKLYLYPSDVENMDLRNTELIFLNTCVSGKGKTLTGEGISGFRRAFGLAGAKYVLSTLENIDDINAVIFAKVFYSKYNDSKDVSKAYKETRYYLKSGAAVKELEDLKPLFDEEYEKLFNEEEYPFFKEKLEQSKLNHCIMTYKNNEWVKEKWGSFILHKC